MKEEGTILVPWVCANTPSEWKAFSALFMPNANQYCRTICGFQSAGTLKWDTRLYQLDRIIPLAAFFLKLANCFKKKKNEMFEMKTDFISLFALETIYLSVFLDLSF